jgi:hypothetical protein
MFTVPGRVPYLVVTERGSTHLKLQWSPPEEMNGLLRGYKIEYGETSFNHY